MRGARMRGHLAPLLVLAVALLLAACGTRPVGGGLDSGGLLADAEQGGFESGPAGDADGTPGPDGAVVDPGTPLGEAAPVTGGAEPGGGGQGAGPAAPAGGGGGGGRTPASMVMGRGVTAQAITVGVIYTVENQSSYAAFGVEGLSQGDHRREAEVLIAAVNAAGGIAGRQVKAVYQGIDQLKGNVETQMQAACSAMSQDNAVFAVLSTIRSTHQLARCLASRGVPLISEYSYNVYRDAEFRQSPGMLYQQGSMSSEGFRAVIDEFAGSGYFSVRTDPATKRPVIGLLRFDGPPYAYLADKVIKPALARHGYQVKEEVAVTTPSSGDAIAAAANQMGSAVLRFRQAGVTHLIFGATMGLGPIIFGPAAESQGYRPVWGLSSWDYPIAAINNVPPAQLTDARLGGWWPYVDTSDASAPPPSPVQKRCLDILRAGGAPPPSRYGAHTALLFCDEILFLQRALSSASELTPAGLRAAVEGLSAGYGSALTFGTRFGPGRYAGVAEVRGGAYDPSCDCFRYTGKVQALP